MLQAAVDAHPRSSGGVVDMSQLRDEVWYNPKQSFEDKCKELDEFMNWLATRKERRVAIVSHGGLLQHWVRAKFGHAEFAMGEFLSAGTTTNTQSHVVLIC